MQSVPSASWLIGWWWLIYLFKKQPPSPFRKLPLNARMTEEERQSFWHFIPQVWRMRLVPGGSSISLRHTARRKCSLFFMFVCCCLQHSGCVLLCLAHGSPENVFPRIGVIRASSLRAGRHNHYHHSTWTENFRVFFSFLLFFTRSIKSAHESLEVD